MEKIYYNERIIKADARHLDDVLTVTREAFKLYQAELGQNSPLTPALLETRESVLHDIQNNHVLIAETDGKVTGAIRFMMLSPRIAYIYRFGVSPALSGTGTGSKLLEATIAECAAQGAGIIALHTNARYFKLARYYYGKEFYVHSTGTEKGYIRALFIKELSLPVEQIDLSPVFAK